MANNQNRDSQDRDQRSNRNQGNFKNDPQRAAEAGRKGGEASHGSGRRSE